MPRTAYVHIGTHKTGTTYLQSWMRKNANTLAQLGIVYPDIGLTPKDAAHKVLALEARTAPDTLSETESWAQLADIVAETSGDVVISSETFSGRMTAPEHVRRLVHFFADLGLQTKFIIFLRDPPAYLNSLYVQAVKRFNAGCSFEDYAAEHFGAPWEDVVPAETMFDRYAAQQELEFPAERVEPLVKTMVDGDFGPRWPFVRRWAYRLKQKATGLFSA
ncbi:hypothetical protein [Tritonibacter mobilis]|uniref:hypothetical protein n=1 Tax=Tritonibacter mobilis TaxID=379347 RepID=UPI000E0CE0D4|nr:hypothetical protein [Tritonibacter mobilis]